MNKRHLIMTLAVLLIIPIFGTQACAQDSIEESIFDDMRLLEFETETEISIDNETLPDFPINLNPGESINNIEATVKFKFDTPSFFPKFLMGTKIGNWVIFRDTEHDMSATLSLSADEVDWVDIELPEKITIESIGTAFKESTFTFNITVNETAIALQEDDINIKATFTPEAAWGLKQSQDKTNFTIHSKFVGKMNAWLFIKENVSEVKFEAGQTKTLKLRIENQYNAEIIVSIEPVEEIANNKIWNVTLEQEQVTLMPGEDKEINVNITAKKSESYENKEAIFMGDILVLTPKIADHQDIVGDKVIVESIRLVAEGESTLWEDIMMMVLYAVIIIVIIAVVLIVILKIKKLKR